mmetsp:Transcript_12739/g.28694  ORF Transcript_12739/g.28694 Transcript_12739/m.28694 type:complete len:130 (+) Transcript_12739:1363-1752(+)
MVWIAPSTLSLKHQEVVMLCVWSTLLLLNSPCGPRSKPTKLAETTRETTWNPSLEMVLCSTKELLVNGKNYNRDLLTNTPGHTSIEYASLAGRLSCDKSEIQTDDERGRGRKVHHKQMAMEGSGETGRD